MNYYNECKNAVYILIIYLTGIFILSNFTTGIFFLSSWFLIIIAFILFTEQLLKKESGLISDSKKNRILIIISIFIISICLRLFFFSHENPLYPDLSIHSGYAESMIAGELPFRDFRTSEYGPIFYYAIYILSRIFSPTPEVLGTAFNFIDSLVSILVAYIALGMGNNLERSAKFGFIYAINPLSMTEIGWSGHMDPLVMFFFLVSIMFFVNKKETLSPVTLGIAGAVKWFPMLLAPIFMRRYVKDTKKLVQYAFFILLGFLISSSYFLIYAPEGFIQQILTHLTSGANFRTLYSFQYYFAENSLLFGAERNTRELIEKVVTIILYIVAFSCLVDYFINGIKVARKWYKVMFLELSIYGILVIEFFILKFHTIDMYHLIFLLFPLGLVISSVIAIDKLYNKKGQWSEFNEIDMLVIVINLLIFTLSTHYAWYYLWVMPLALLMNKRIRWNMMLCTLLSMPLAYMYIPFFPVGV